MDESKKKMVLALVAVLALGAAGYTMFSGESAPKQQAVKSENQRKRTVRAKRDTKKKAVRKRRNVDPVKTAAKRAPRERTERKASSTKKRRGKGRKLEKKKKMVPAS